MELPQPVSWRGGTTASCAILHLRHVLPVVEEASRQAHLPHEKCDVWQLWLLLMLLLPAELIDCAMLMLHLLPQVSAMPL